MKSKVAAGMLTLILCSISASCRADRVEKPWVSVSSDGTLTYRETAAGDRVMDFSVAGYHAGGVAIPSPQALVTVSPGQSGDDALAVQKAIDQVSALPLTNGFRGVVLLKPGTFRSESTITIKASGVVLRGSGSGADGTILLMEGKPHAAIVIDGPRIPAEPPVVGTPVRVIDRYVPSGASGLEVADPSAFSVNDTVQIVKSITPEWVKFMGMDTLVRNGKPERWNAGEIRLERRIATIDRARLVFDAPLTDSLDAKFLGPTGATVVKIADPGRLSEIGVESMKIVSPPQKVALLEPAYRGITADGVTDAWIRDMVIEETIGSVTLMKNARRLTVERVTTRHTTTIVGAAKPSDFQCDGSQILIDRCGGTGDNLFYVATGSRVYGPNVVLNCKFNGNGQIQPHHRWATGLLVDNCEVPSGGIDFMNRGFLGSGHGWTIGWAVAWNCSAKQFLIQQPPGAYNWAIGCIGTQTKAAMPIEKTGKSPANQSPLLPQGEIESPGQRVEPASLYLAQLKQRLGPAAVKNIGH